MIERDVSVVWMMIRAPIVMGVEEVVMARDIVIIINIIRVEDICKWGSGPGFGVEGPGVMC